MQSQRDEQFPIWDSVDQELFARKAAALIIPSNHPIYEQIGFLIDGALALKNMEGDKADRWPDLFTDASQALLNKKNFTLTENTDSRELLVALDSLYQWQQNSSSAELDCAKSRIFINRLPDPTDPTKVSSKISYPRFGFGFINMRNKFLSLTRGVYVPENNLRLALIQAIARQANRRLPDALRNKEVDVENNGVTPPVENKEVDAEKNIVTKLVDGCLQFDNKVQKLIFINNQSLDNLLANPEVHGVVVKDITATLRNSGLVTASREFEQEKRVDLTIRRGEDERTFNVYHLKVKDFDSLQDTELTEIAKAYHVYQASKNKTMIVVRNSKEQILRLVFAMVDNFPHFFEMLPSKKYRINPSAFDWASQFLIPVVDQESFIRLAGAAAIKINTKFAQLKLQNSNNALQGSRGGTASPTVNSQVSQPAKAPNPIEVEQKLGSSSARVQQLMPALPAAARPAASPVMTASPRSPVLEFAKSVYKPPAPVPLTQTGRNLKTAGGVFGELPFVGPAIKGFFVDLSAKHAVGNPPTTAGNPPRLPQQLNK